MDDRTIIIRCQHEQTQLLGILIQRYHDSLIRFCYYLTGDKEKAAELYQESWERVLLNISRCNPERPFGNWLFAITTNLYKDTYRKRKRWLSIFKDYFHQDELDKDLEGATDCASPEQEYTRQEDRQLLRKCILELDDVHRIPLLLYYYRDLSIEDVAEILNIPAGTVKSRLHYAKKKLRTKLEVMRS